MRFFWWVTKIPFIKFDSSFKKLKVIWKTPKLIFPILIKIFWRKYWKVLFEYLSMERRRKFHI
jgi:hypothetical protein